jgi:branched-subunit amino acid aminotransferase/4-amino-4-deoxychorismate lyase
MMYLWNGMPVEKENAIISFFSPAVQCGYGAYETLRTYSGKVFKKEEHLDRLMRSAAMIGLRFPSSVSQIGEWIEETLKSITGEAKITIVVIPEGVMVGAEALQIDPGIYNGVALKSVFRPRSNPDFKTLSSRLDGYIAQQMAERDDFFSAVLTDADEKVTECAKANIFWFDGEKLSTPDDRIMKGVTRELVLEHSCFPLKLQTCTLRELCRSEEVFLTCTSMGIVPVTRIDDEEIGSGTVGERTRQLMNIFEKLCQ